MPLTLYAHRLSQPCRAVEILLRELGVDYDWQEIDFAGGETRQQWFAREINPMQTVPALAVSDPAGASGAFVLGESHAIMRYLCRTAASEAAPHWYPDRDDAARAARIDQWMAWHHNNVRRHDMFHHIMNLHRTLPMLKYEIQNTLLRPLQAGLNAGLARLEAHLARPTRQETPAMLCGHEQPTLADLTIACELYQIVAVGYRFHRYPRVASWLDTLAARPHFRDISAEIRDQGRIIHDESGGYLELEQAFA